MAILPRAQCICPSCFEEIDLRECDIVSGVTRGKVLKKASRLSRFQISLESLDGLHYTREQAHRRCLKCHYLLPYNIERVHNISLSVAGDVHSGKSLYIASLVHQLRREWGRNATSGSLQTVCLTPDIEKDFRQRYMDPLFDNRIAVLATRNAVKRDRANPQPLVDHPLIYNIRISPSHRHPPHTFNLLIYDTSGEDFGDIGKMVTSACFTLRSSAFIFVADPFSMGPVIGDLRTSLRGTVPPLVGRQPIEDMLGRILNEVKRSARMGEVSRLADIPIAVMVSKADIFAKGLQSPYSSPAFSLNDYPQYDFRIDLDDINYIHREVENLLIHYKQDNIICNTKGLEKHHFFATSATGVPPDQANHFPDVKPWRCLDPLLWILYELGFIKIL